MKTGARLVLGKDDEGRRLDRVLRIALGGMPLSAIHRALRKGDIRVGGARRDPESRCAAGDIVEISGVLLSPGANLPGEPSEKPQAESPPADQNSSRHSPTPSSAFPILLETPDLVFVDKPIGILVHDGDDSLEALVRQYLAPTLAPSLSFAPGPLHRLDRNTSGVVAFSKSIDGARAFSEALRERRITKTYLALLEGRIEGNVAWDDLIVRDGVSRRSLVSAASDVVSPPRGANPSTDPRAAGAKEALTEVTPLAFSDGFTLAEIALGTGRTHQIRAQAAAHGHPLAGDRKYGGQPCEQPYYLHAWRLSTSGIRIAELPPAVEAPIPYYFIEKLRERFPEGEFEVYLGLDKL
mgnify:CR=1 FL=1